VRSEGDTWDITTSVGATALFVATARALEAQKPDPLAVDPYAEVFCRAVGGRVADVLDGKIPDHELKTEDFGRHFVDFQGARTKYFDEYFRRVADAGVRQVVILAAGLDSRAYRLPWPDGTTVFELDRPQVLDFKREVLASQGAEPRAERREVAVDLREDWPQALRDNGFDATKPSAWIAEGLLIYLPADAELQLFTGIDSLSCAGSHVAVEDGAPIAQDEYEARLEEERSTPGQREFFQLVYNEQHASATEWFSDHGWNAVGTPLADYLREVGRPVPGPESQFRSAVARNTLVSAVKG
jgi:methyltransferase (TIGR00027 family)